MQQRDFEGAERSFHKALEANPRSSLAHLEIGLLYLSHKNDPAAAIYHLKRYLKLKPDAPNGTEVSGQIEALKGDLAKDILGTPQHAPNSSIQQLRLQLNQLAAENQALRHQLQSRGLLPIHGQPPIPRYNCRIPTPAAAPHRAAGHRSTQAPGAIR